MKQLLYLIIGLFIFNTIFSQEKTKEKASEKTFSIDEKYNDIENIKITVISSNISIKPSTDKEVHLNGILKWKKPNHQVSIVAIQKGSLLEINVVYPEKFKNDNVTGQITIDVPEDIDFIINSISGDIQMQDTGKNKIVINNVSGKILCSKINCDIEISSVSGRINISSANGNVKCTSVSADQYISQVSKDFNGSTISGDFYLSDIKGNTRTNSVSGKVH